MKTSRIFSIAALLSLATALPAMADTVSMTNTSIWPTDFIFVNIKYNGVNVGNEPAGAIAWNVNSAGTTPALYGQLDSKLVTYCIEIGQDVYVGSTDTWTVASLVGAPIATGGGGTLTPPDPVGGMSQSQANLIYTLAELYGPQYFPAHPASTNTAAMQLAIWEIIYGNGTYSYNATANTLTSNLFVATGTDATTNAVIAQSSVYLASAQASVISYPSGPGFESTGVVALTSLSIQDQVLAFMPTTPSVTGAPLPPVTLAGFSMMALFGLGFLSIRAKRA